MAFGGLTDDEYGQALRNMGQSVALNSPAGQSTGGGPQFSSGDGGRAVQATESAMAQTAAEDEQRKAAMKTAASLVAGFFTGGASLAASGAAGGAAASGGTAAGSALGAAAAPTAAATSAAGNAAVTQALGQSEQLQAAQAAVGSEAERKGVMGNVFGMFGGG